METAKQNLATIQTAVKHMIQGDLEKAHSLLQDIDSEDASYLHGIIHRKEKDYDNAEYWFKRVGKHPVIAAVMKRFPDYDPIAIVALCRRASESDESAGFALLENAELAAFQTYLAK